MSERDGGAITRPATWRAISTALFVVFLVAFAIEGFDGVPGWGWIALIGSGATFGVEVLLMLGQRSRG